MTGPVSSVIGRTKLILASSVVYASSAPSVVCTAQPIAESSIVIAKPPWTTPIGLYRYSPASPVKVTLPSSAAPPVKPIVSVIGGFGSRSWKIARMNSSPLMPALFASAVIGSSQVIVRVRAFVLTSFIESHRLFQLGNRDGVDCRDAYAPDRRRRKRAGQRQPYDDLPGRSKCRQHLGAARNPEDCDQDGDAERDPKLSRHPVDGAAGGKARRRQ